MVPPSDDDALRALVASALSATYDLEHEIGRGGMGIVYRARDRRLKRPVAIKVLPPELAFRRDVRSRFLREAETAAQLNHPHIVPIYAVDEVESLVYFVMACVDGPNLARQVATRGPLPIAEVRRWLTEVSEALAYAHARGVVHRDIKPDNILIDGIDGRALVTDFGIARAVTETGDPARLTVTGMALGTPAYMSPEQASADRDLDARSDLYSLGVVAYQMLVGEPPFVGNATPALLVKHLSEVPVPVAARRPDVPHELAALVMRLLEKLPEQRIQTAQELVQALKGAPEDLSPERVSSDVQPPYIAPAYTARTGVVPAVPAEPPPSPSRSDAPVRAATHDPYAPTAEERARWNAPQVRAFRRALAPYLFVNAAIVAVAVVTPKNYLSVTAIWTIVLAWKYGKLWTQGYDWHDVMRQPTHRLLGEVLSDLADSLRATFSRRQREALLASGRLPVNPLARALAVQTPVEGTAAPRSAATSWDAGSPTDGGQLYDWKYPSTPTSAPPTNGYGVYADAVRVARGLHADIAQAVRTSASLGRSARREALEEAARHLAVIDARARELGQAEADRAADRAAAIKQEIATLELEADPTDVARSDARVRRLAQLRRDRRALHELTERREIALGEMEAARARLDALLHTLRQPTP